MRRAALLTALLTLSGCATLRQALPSLVRPTPAAAASPGPGAPSGGPVTTPPAAPASAPVPTPSGSAPPPASPAPTAAPAPPLTASLSPVETRRLREDAHRRIDDAARLLRQLEGRPFAPKDLETLSLAHSLVEQARKALGSEEYERAANLAVKARTLAEDLSTRR